MNAQAPTLDLAECLRFLRFWPEVTCTPHTTLVAIEPDRGGTHTTTFAKSDGDCAGRWIAEHQGAGRNVYFQPNETPPGCTSKPAKAAMVAALCRHADVDPDDEHFPFVEERERLVRLAERLMADPEMRPTAIIDSGNGLQPLWVVTREALTPDVLRRTEAENKALERALGASGTQNIDRLLRLAGTLNFPNAAKRKRGRAVVRARLIHAAGSIYSAADASRLGAYWTAALQGTDLVRPKVPAGAEQQRTSHAQAETPAPVERTPGTVENAAPGRDADLVRLVASLEAAGATRITAEEHLPAAVRDRLAAALAGKTRRVHRKLQDRWAGLVDDLTAAGKDDTRSGVDMSLAALLNIAGFDPLETGLVLCAFPHGKANGESWPSPALRLRHVVRCTLRTRERRVSNRPTIRVAAGDMPANVDQAEQALIETGAGIYQRGAFLVRAGRMHVHASDDRSVLAQRIIQVGDHALMEAMTSAARWERFDGRSEELVATDAPMKIVKAYKDRVGHWRLPVLAGITNAPTLRADGSILATPGYDAASGLLYDPCGAEFPAIPEHPTEEEAHAALGLLRGLVETFPFVAEADRAVALSAMLTACIRRSLPTAPMHAFTAPTAGSGKSMLVDLCSVIATGREAGVIAQGQNEEELQKRLGALLLAGDQVFAIDNCEAPLGGEFLCQVLTQPVVRARILGRSEAPELPANAFVTATGNNLALVGDMTRRAVLCRLDPGCERPELRTFARSPVAAAKAGRGRYLVAALTMLRAFVVAGRPRQRDPLGSFEDWSLLVRDALLWLWEADPCDTMERLRSQDPKLDALGAVVTQWHAVIGTDRVPVREVIERATCKKSGDDWTQRGEFSHPDFREALLSVAGEGGAINSKRLGKWLAANQGRVVAGCKILQDKLNAGTMTWRLEAVP